MIFITAFRSKLSRATPCRLTFIYAYILATLGFTRNGIIIVMYIIVALDYSHSGIFSDSYLYVTVSNNPTDKIL